MLTRITSLLIFGQAFTAGQFVSQDNRDAWIIVHGVMATATLLAGCLAALYAIVVLRRTARVETVGSIVLFVLLVLQTITGRLITAEHMHGLIGVHVPLALVVFAGTVALSLRTTAHLRRSAGA
jgi:lipopolysaccharide export LptBFGC system permease protein LptF